MLYLPRSSGGRGMLQVQADNIAHTEVKRKIGSEYIRRVRKILKSKLNGGNTIQAINTWAIPVIRYTAGIIDWTQAELETLDRKTRKIMTINHALHPRSDVDRLYFPRSSGGRGMLQVHQTVEEEKIGLEEYIKDSEEDALQMVKNEKLFNTNETKQAYRKEQVKNQAEKWRNKPLHGQYLHNISGKSDITKTWQWLKNGNLKKETEGLILAAQEQALRTNAIRAKVEKSTTNSKCRLCKEANETVDHLISCCKKIAQTDYKQRHDKVAGMMHWNICKKYKLPVAKNWWDHQIEKVEENEDVKILWGFRLQTDKHLPHNTPDITVVEKKEKQVKIIDIAIPGDSRIEEKEIEKITKYKDLQIEIERLWQKKTKIIPVVIGALGAVPKDLEEHLNTIGATEISISQLQKAALLGTAYILRRYL
ncbi:uncharacterized protein LOC128343627 isoform X2 [Hemicordylus capensis]|uniref:uncharacterized protein LOC128343627 isoform X2 n=1 Tax=Hemicordylus capensis TaxID=884348 RepID=UPI0023028134|nr:uncharacterized protein LOC128343627 isoform X2 [Hemicordylus capensis]XP_053149010.1 uncharacterized protein LOC128343627 isoform X2 [Hemicordylus capensis]